MLPEFVRAVKGVQPTAWVAENVPAIASRKFAPHINATLIGPLSRSYRIVRFELDAQSFGLPQVRRRVFFVGVRKSSRALTPPAATHTPHGAPDDGGVELPRTMGVRQALGLPAIGFDGPAPTLRSTLTGPRHTTSVLSSASAQKRWARLGIWPNGVAADREHARAFVARDGHFRMSVDDCAVIQGFPADWRFHGPVYMALGQLGNSVAPPVGYAVARAVARSLS